MKWIRKWWDGEWVNINEPDSRIVFMPYQEHHWTARAVRASLQFCAREWKWLIGIAIAIAAVIVRIGR
jgi:hypothetical protein